MTIKIGSNIAALCDEHGLTQAQLSRALNVDTSTVSNWCNDKRKPSLEAVVQLADLFNTSVDAVVAPGRAKGGTKNNVLSASEKQLLADYKALDKYGKTLVRSVCTIELERCKEQRQPSDHAIVLPSAKGQIPLFEMPAAAGWSAPIDEYDYTMIDVSNETPKEANFAVKIQGNSMFPYVRDRQIAYVQQTEELGVNDIGIISVNGATYCKFLYRDERGDVDLVSANPDYKNSNVHIDATSGDSVRVFGRVLLNERTRFPAYFLEEL